MGTAGSGRADVVAVEDPRDPRLRDYVALRDVQLRLALEAEHGLFVAEGEKVIRRAVAAGFAVRSFLLTPRWLDALREVVAAAGAPCYLVRPEVAEQVSGFHVHRGALASLRRRPPRPVAQVLAGARRVVVLEDLVDHANLGAVLRSAAALGMDAAVLSPRCADPLYRRAVKVSMGAVCTLPYARLPDWYEGPDLLRHHGFRLVALTPRPDATPLGRLPLSPTERVALLLGTEGAGLSDRWLAAADELARIPMAPGIDSLNVAAAAAIACYLLGPAAAAAGTSDSSKTGAPGAP